MFHRACLPPQCLENQAFSRLYYSPPSGWSSTLHSGANEPVMKLIMNRTTMTPHEATDNATRLVETMTRLCGAFTALRATAPQPMYSLSPRLQGTFLDACERQAYRQFRLDLMYLFTEPGTYSAQVIKAPVGLGDATMPLPSNTVTINVLP